MYNEHYVSHTSVYSEKQSLSFKATGFNALLKFNTIGEALCIHRTNSC